MFGPTIRPAMNTASKALISMPMRPTPTPPGDTSPSFMLTSGIMPPSGVKLSCAQLTAPVDVPVVEAANTPGDGGAEADLLALHVAAGLVGRDRLVDPAAGQLRVAVLLEEAGHQRRR